MSFKTSVQSYFRETAEINKKRLKKIVLNAAFWFILAAVVLIAIGSIRIAVLTRARSEQYMAEVWGQTGDTLFRQVSVFARGSRSSGMTSPMMYTENNISLRKSDIPLIRASLQSAVDTGIEGRNKGLNTDGSPKGWEDCYSTTYQASVSEVTASDTETVNTIDGVEIVGIGGNFKAFHPFRYLSGGFLPEEVDDRYQIVLNDVLAWRFFNSYNVTGNKVSIGGVEFTVIGVVEEGTSSVDKMVGTTEPRAYIYFDTIDIICSQENAAADDELTDPELDDGESKTVAIQCYEAILPELVRGVANTDIKNALPEYSINDPQMYVVSNTDRFSVGQIWKWVFPIGENSYKLSGYEFPYWETAAQITTDKIAIDAVLIISGSVLLIAGTLMAVLRSRKFNKAIEAEETQDKTAEDSL